MSYMGRSSFGCRETVVIGAPLGYSVPARRTNGHLSVQQPAFTWHDRTQRRNCYHLFVFDIFFWVMKFSVIVRYVYLHVRATVCIFVEMFLFVFACGVVHEWFMGL